MVGEAANFEHGMTVENIEINFIGRVGNYVYIDAGRVLNKLPGPVLRHFQKRAAVEYLYCRVGPECPIFFGLLF